MRQLRPLFITGLAAAVLATTALGASPGPKGESRPIGEATKALPGPTPGGGFDLPNGWRITPAGKRVADTNDLILKMVPSPDGRVIVAGHGGYLPHGLSVIDAKTHRLV
jgi:hypothetical protein